MNAWWGDCCFSPNRVLFVLRAWDAYVSREQNVHHSTEELLSLDGTSGVKLTKHSTVRTSYQVWNTVVVVVVVWRCGDVLLLPGQTFVKSARQSWVRRISGRQFVIWSSDPMCDSKSTSEWLKWKKKKVLDRPSQPWTGSLYSEALGVTKINQFCKEAWARIPPQ